MAPTLETLFGNSEQLALSPKLQALVAETLKQYGALNWQGTCDEGTNKLGALNAKTAHDLVACTTKAENQIALLHAKVEMGRTQMNTAPAEENPAVVAVVEKRLDEYAQQVAALEREHAGFVANALSSNTVLQEATA